MAVFDIKLVRTARACVLAAVSVVALAAVPAVAQEVNPEQFAAARKYVDLTDSSSIFETTLIQTGVQTMNQIVTQNPEIQEQTSAVIGEVIKEYVESKDELLNQFARVYAVRFTLEELNEINAFYESPVGQKLTSENTTINSDMRRVLQVYLNTLRPEFLAKVRAALRAQGVEI
jgi:uncharacterized protein